MLIVLHAGTLNPMLFKDPPMTTVRVNVRVNCENDQAIPNYGLIIKWKWTDIQYPERL